jgi:hypothetical protein
LALRIYDVPFLGSLVDLVLAEVRHRLANGKPDDSESCEGELAAAVSPFLKRLGEAV